MSKGEGTTKDGFKGYHLYYQVPSHIVVPFNLWKISKSLMGVVDGEAM